MTMSVGWDRPLLGGHKVRIALLVLLMLVVLFVSTAAAPVEAERTDAGVKVRNPEGTVHGFLTLHTTAGELLAHGDLLQLVNDGAIASRMMFHFRNSVFDETVTFTQRGVFTMQAYHLVQSGPAFAEDMDATLLRRGAYTVRTKSHDDGKEQTYRGTLGLPPDVYNGMVITVAKNLPSGGNVHIVAFTPEPRIIDLELEPAGTSQVALGEHREAVQHLIVKPHLGAVRSSGPLADEGGTLTERFFR